MVAGQQDQRGWADAVVESALECREVVEHLGAQSVDGGGAIAGQVGASAGEDVQIHSDVVSGADGLEVAPHAGLVGDDYRVLGVGLSVALYATETW